MSSGKVGKITEVATETTKKHSRVEDYIDPQEANKLLTDMERDNLVRQKIELVESQIKFLDEKGNKIFANAVKFNKVMEKHNKYVESLKGKENKHSHGKISYEREVLKYENDVEKVKEPLKTKVWEWKGTKVGSDITGSLQIEKIVHGFETPFAGSSLNINKENYFNIY